MTAWDYAGSDAQDEVSIRPYKIQSVLIPGVAPLRALSIWTPRVAFSMCGVIDRLSLAGWQKQQSAQCSEEFAQTPPHACTAFTCLFSLALCCFNGSCQQANTHARLRYCVLVGNPEKSKVCLINAIQRIGSHRAAWRRKTHVEGYKVQPGE